MVEEEEVNSVEPFLVALEASGVEMEDSDSAFVVVVIVVAVTVVGAAVVVVSVGAVVGVAVGGPVVFAAVAAGAAAVVDAVVVVVVVAVTFEDGRRSLRVEVSAFGELAFAQTASEPAQLVIVAIDELTLSSVGFVSFALDELDSIALA